MSNYPHFGHGQTGNGNFNRDLSTYLIGDVVAVPARAGFDGNPSVQLKGVPTPDAILRWKVMLAASIPFGTSIPANAALGLRFFAQGRMGNEQIPRRCFIRAGVGNASNNAIVSGAQTLYVPGRTLDLFAVNPSNVTINAVYGVDGGTAGFSYWSDFEEVEVDTATAVELDAPAFTRTFTVYGLSTAGAPEIRGYNALGTLIYQDVLTAGNSGPQELDPHLRYTIRASVGSATYSIVYNCLG